MANPFIPLSLKDKDIEVAFTHDDNYGDYYSFVNGQHTTMGGTHLNAFRESIAKTIKDFYKRTLTLLIFELNCRCISIKVEDPVFESQTKTKLGSQEIGPDGPTIRTFVNNFLKENLDNYLHRETDTAKIL